MKARAIICCAGSAERWNNYHGVPKHLVPIDGRPLLTRTIEQLHVAGIHDIVVTAFDPDYALAATGALVCRPGETIMPGTGIGFSACFWAMEPVAVLFGDTVFSERCITEIVAGLGCNEVAWIGRGGNAPAMSTIDKYGGELFAVTIPPEQQPAMRVDAQQVVDRYVAGKIEKITGWELRAVHGGQWVEIDDETEDFDYPEQYDAWMERHRS